MRHGQQVAQRQPMIPAAPGWGRLMSTPMNHLRSRAQQPGGRAVVRVKRIDVRAYVGVLVAFAVLCAMALATGSAFALNPERHYEQVSPAYKGGFGVGGGGIQAVAENGESLAFFAPAAFEEAPEGLTHNLDTLDYIARRSASGWSTVPVMPPATLLPAVPAGDPGEGNRDVSPDLGMTLALGSLGPSTQMAEKTATEAGLFLHSTELPDVSTDWSPAGPLLTASHPQALSETPGYLGGSPDFCHLLLRESTTDAHNSSNITDALLKQADGATEQLYELARGCNGETPSLRLVSINNKGDVMTHRCPVDLGLEQFAQPSSGHKLFNAVAADGEFVFFTTCVNDAEANRIELADHQLFLRLGHLRTIEVSKPIGEICSEVPCGGAMARPSADFVGASENGSKVFFATTAPLDPTTDKDNGKDLYMASIGCARSEPACEVSERVVTSLVQVSRSSLAGEAAELQGVVRVAPDGERVYFVARGVLTEGANVEGREAIQGADNLYVYNSVSGKAEFIADLCSAHDISGIIEDRHCPNEAGETELPWRSERDLWLHSVGVGDGFVQTAGVGGQYLVFSSYSQLTSDDTDTAADTYRFDAETGMLERVSVGENGDDDNGNSNNYDALIRAGNFGASVLLQHEMDNRDISEDGSRIIFSTAEPLSPAAINGLTNLYEWHENPSGVGGSVSLLSGGTGSTPVEDAVISPDGGNVFFVTSEGLVPQDVDGEDDVYDARLGAGFPTAPAATEPCSGDACQGPLTNPEPLLVPGSAVQASGGNVLAIAPVKTVMAKKTVAKCAKGKQRQHGRCVKRKKAKTRMKAGKTGRRTSR
jgi:hypothetical protein